MKPKFYTMVGVVESLNMFPYEMQYYSGKLEDAKMVSADEVEKYINLIEDEITMYKRFRRLYYYIEKRWPKYWDDYSRYIDETSGLDKTR